MGVTLDTFTRVVEGGSGFGVVDEIADCAHPGKPCAVLGAATAGLPGLGPGPCSINTALLPTKRCSLIILFSFLHYTRPERPPSTFYFANRYR
jgi:hypothetical protein